MLITKSNIFLIGPVAVILGYIMNGIFWAQSQIGIENIGLCIILFTIVIYMLMTPLTIQQQKFSRLSAKMNPELQAIQKKYKGKKQDQEVVAKMNEETQAIYAKYGVNPMGSCVQLIIQMPILFALYRVIWNIPAYVDKVKAAFDALSQVLMNTAGAEAYLTEVASVQRISFPQMDVNTIIDVLYKFKPADWAALTEKFPALTDTIASTQSNVDRMNYFLGLNIADAPMSIMTTAFQSGAILMAIGALAIPVLAAVTQWLNAKLMSSANPASGNGENGSVESTMKTMNTVMPLMSAVFCLSLPVGLGIYWIAGAVVRSVQQLIINKKIDKMDLDEVVKKNLEKLNKKRVKQGLPPQKMQDNAKISTKNINTSNNDNYVRKNVKADIAKKASDIPETKTASSAKPGSLAAKAMMVKEYNEQHSKK